MCGAGAQYPPLVYLLFNVIPSAGTDAAHFSLRTPSRNAVVSSNVSFSVDFENPIPAKFRCVAPLITPIHLHPAGRPRSCIRMFRSSTVTGTAMRSNHSHHVLIDTF